MVWFEVSMDNKKCVFLVLQKIFSICFWTAVKNLNLTAHHFVFLST